MGRVRGVAVGVVRQATAVAVVKPRAGEGGAVFQIRRTAEADLPQRIKSAQRIENGSHGTDPGLTGERTLVNPVGPGWASPEGKWDEARLRGRDNLPYGPLSREGAHFEWGCFTEAAGGRSAAAHWGRLDRSTAVAGQ